jgi:hypothetical protein
VTIYQFLSGLWFVLPLALVVLVMTWFVDRMGSNMDEDLNGCRKCGALATVFWVNPKHRWCAMHVPNANWEPEDDE